MSYEDEELLTDAKGKPIPQVLDSNTGTFVPLTTSMMSSGGGSGNSYSVLKNGDIH